MWVVGAGGVLALAALSCCGCGESPIAGDDSGTTPPLIDAGAPDAALPSPAAPAAPPVLTPCPGGWRELVPARDGPPTCEPWPATGVATCAPDEAHFVGEPGCRRIGSACPAAGEFASDLPTGPVVLYVRQGATSGDGTRTSPFGTIADALATATPGSVVALAAGIYDEPLVITTPVTLWGACVAGTTLATSVPSSSSGVVTVQSTGVALHNLRIGDSPRPGIWTHGAGYSLVLRSVLIDRVTYAGATTEASATLDAEDLVVRDTQAFTGIGRGLNVESRATGTVRRAVLERNVEVGALGHGVGTSFVLESVAVRGTLGTSTAGRAGAGISTFAGASVSVRDSVVEGNHTVGTFATGTGSRLVLEGVVVRDTEPEQATGLFGRGVDVEAGASAELRRCTLERNHDISALVGNGMLVIADTVIRQTRPRAADADSGRGVDVDVSATASLTRVWIEDNREVAILVGGAGTTAELTDVTIRDTTSREADGTNGRAMVVELGAAVRGERMDVARSQQIAIFVGQDGTRVDLFDLRVSDTIPQTCVGSTCPDISGGIGIGIVDHAVLTLSRFVVTRSIQCGVLLARGAEVDLTSGEISHADIGACVQIPGYDFGRLAAGVLYHDNTSGNVSATMLPVPDPTPPAL